MAIFSQHEQKSDSWPEAAPIGLRKKIILPTAGISLLLMALGVSGAWYVLWLQRLNSQVLDTNVLSIRAAEELEIVVRQTRHQLDRFLLTQDRDHFDQALEKQRDVEVWMQQALMLADSEQEARLVAEIQRGLDEFFGRLRELGGGAGQSVPTVAGSVGPGRVQRNPSHRRPPAGDRHHR